MANRGRAPTPTSARHGADPHPAPGTLEARGKVLVKLNVAGGHLVR